VDWIGVGTRSRVCPTLSAKGVKRQKTVAIIQTQECGRVDKAGRPRFEEVQELRFGGNKGKFQEQDEMYSSGLLCVGVKSNNLQSRVKISGMRAMKAELCAVSAAPSENWVDDFVFQRPAGPQWSTSTTKDSPSNTLHTRPSASSLSRLDNHPPTA